MTENEALAAAISGEDAAVYAFGVIAAYVRTADRDRAVTQLERHRRARDELAAELTALGGTPPPAAAAYDLPVRVSNSRTAKEVAGYVLLRLVGPYATLASVAAADARPRYIDAARAHATRAMSWGAEPVAFPGDS